MYVYLSVYLLQIVFFFISHKMENKKQRNVFVIITLFLLWIISGTRYNIGGWDYGTYQGGYNRTPDLLHLNIPRMYAQYDSYLGTDVLFTVFNSFLKTCGLSFYGATLVYAAFFYISFYKCFSKYTEEMNFTMFIMFYKLFLDVTFVYMRQSIAIGMFFIGLELLRKNKIIPYCILSLAAYMVHTSAIAFFLFLAIYKLKVTKRRLLISTVAMTPVYITAVLKMQWISEDNIILQYFATGQNTEKIDRMISGSALYQVSFLHLAEYLLLMILLIKFWDKITKEYDDIKDLMIKCFWTILPLYTVFSNYDALIRFKYYFIMSYAFIIMYVMDSLKKYKKIVTVLTIIICLAGMAKYALQFSYGDLIDYRSWLFRKGVSIFLR